MKSLISSHWSNNELPGINCVANADGKITLLNCYRNEEGKPYSFPFCETTIESLLKYNEDIWTEVQAFTKIFDESNGLFYVAGEGGMGNEGFIACTDNLNNLIWGVFFENSNPFSRLEITENKLYAFSTSEEIYVLDLDYPQNVTVKK